MNTTDKNKFYAKVNKTAKEADIFIYGVIGSKNYSWWMEEQQGTDNTAYSFINMFRKIEAEADRINVHIHSPGGYITEGLVIYNALKNSAKDIHTYNDGMTASMASVILLAGKTIHMPESAIFHLHGAQSGLYGYKQDFENGIKELITFEKSIVGAIQARTNLSTEEIEKTWLDGKDHYYVGSEAKELGFVDVIEGQVIANAINDPSIKNLEYGKLVAMFNPTANKKDKSIFERFTDFINGLTTDLPDFKNNSNSTAMNKFKTNVAFLLAALALSEFTLNAQNKAELSIEELLNLENKYNELNAKATAAEAAATEAKAQLTAKDAEITELKAKLAGKPVAQGANPKGEGDGEKPDGEPTDWNPEASKLLADYRNRK